MLEVLECTKLHTKFQGIGLLVLEEQIFKGFNIDGHGDRDGHVIQTISITFRS